jgi:hypothetical protein
MEWVGSSCDVRELQMRIFCKMGEENERTVTIQPFDLYRRADNYKFIAGISARKAINQTVPNSQRNSQNLQYSDFNYAVCEIK